MRRARGQIVLAVLFTLLALNAWLQCALVVLGHSDDPTLLAVLQALVGAAGAAAGWGIWTASRWAPAAAVGYGAVTAGMLLGLVPILGLEAEERSGLWAGVAAVLAFALWTAWYLRRVVHRAWQTEADRPAV